MKPPEECTTLEQIRAAIDDIDSEIVGLIGRRRGYVHAAAAFKTSEASVRASDRVTEMIARRRQWATEVRLNPDVIEHLFRTLVSYFTDAELQQWTGQNESGS